MKKVFTSILLFIFLLQVSAQLDSCLYFNNSKITISPLLKNELGTGDFTLEAKIKGSEANNFTHSTFLSNRSSSFNGIIFGVHNQWGGSLNKMLYLQHNGVNYFVLNNGVYNNSILDDSCHHVAVTKKNDSLFFYIDGVHIGSRFINGSINVNANNFTIAYDNTASTAFIGNISLLRVWSVARTHQEIIDGKNNGVSINSNGLLGYWTLSRIGSNAVDQVEEDLTGQYNGVWGNNTTVEPEDPSVGSFCCYGIISPSVPASLVSSSEQESLFLYPNPSAHLFTLKTNSEAVFEVTVLDALGLVVYQNKSFLKSKA